MSADTTAEVRRLWSRRCARFGRSVGDLRVEIIHPSLFAIRENAWLRAYYVMQDGRPRYAGMPRGAIDSHIRAAFLWGCPDARISPSLQTVESIEANVPDHLTIEWNGAARIPTPRRFRDWRLHVRENVCFLPSDYGKPISIKVVWHNHWKEIGQSIYGESRATLTFKHTTTKSKQGDEPRRHSLWAEGFNLTDEHVVRLSKLLPSIRRTATSITLDETDLIHLKLMM